MLDGFREGLGFLVFRSVNENRYVNHKAGDGERIVNELSFPIANSAFLTTFTKAENGCTPACDQPACYQSVLQRQ